MTDRQPKVAKWDKDGRWHISEQYHPTQRDRIMFPVSYPDNDTGPFYIWSAESFETEAQAQQALAAQI